MLKIYLLVTSFLFIELGFSQKCDCDIFPLKNECKEICGIKILQNGNKEQLKKKLSLTDETIKRIVAIPSRKVKTSVNDYQDELPCKYFNELITKYNIYYSVRTTQNNVIGDNISGDKIMGTKIVNTNASIKDSLEQIKKREIRIELGKYMNQGILLRERCRTDSLNSKLEEEANSWYANVIFYLDFNLDESYSTQFKYSEATSLSPGGVPEKFIGLWLGINQRIERLSRFIDQLR